MSDDYVDALIIALEYIKELESKLHPEDIELPQSRLDILND